MFFNIKFFFLLFLLFNNFFTYNAHSKESNDFYKDEFCSNIDLNELAKYKIPNEIHIQTNNSKKWSKNLFELFIDFNSERYKTDKKLWYSFQIDNKFKKKFKSKVKFVFTNPNYECLSKAEISVRGNLWWHLNWENGVPFTSLRVDLKNGHINNLVKFNLLIPEARTSYELSKKNNEYSKEAINVELLVSKLLNKIGLLAPKTYLLKVFINNNPKLYLFQEVLSKEFLETRNLVEGPILIGDHRFTTDQVSENQWRGDLGLAKIMNLSYPKKNEVSQQISLYALSIMNYAYLYSSKRDKNETRCRNEYLTLDENLLKHYREIKENQIYEAVIYALEAEHSLSCDDRKFYYDPHRQIFFPIYNDGKSNLDINNNNISSSIAIKDVTKNSVKGAQNALALINNINDLELYKELILSGFSLEYFKYTQILNKVRKNLEALSKIDLKILDINKNTFNPDLKYFEQVNPNFEGKNTKLIFYFNHYIEICEFKLLNCEKKNDFQNSSNIKALLDQNFEESNKNKKYFDKKNNFLFLSITKDYNDLSYLNDLRNNYNYKKVNSFFYLEFNNFADIDIDYKNKKINITFTDLNGRVKVLGEKVDSWSFDLDFIQKKNFESLKNNIYTSNYTGCLTFLDIKLIEVSLTSKNMKCEDSINFVRTQGTIKEANILASSSDGLDFDFSEVTIKELTIKESKNDCLDFSYGVYFVYKASIETCGDKGISVGEKSQITISNTLIEKTKIGVASKDSSRVIVKNSNIKSDICFAAYRKKQEFSGALINRLNTKCDSNKILKQKGSQIY